MLFNRNNTTCEIIVDHLHEHLTFNLKHLRINAGLTQEQVSKIAMVSRSTYSRIERGKATPDLQTLCFLANHYGTGIDKLIGANSGKAIRHN